MLACDLIVQVRASRSVSAEQAREMERSISHGIAIPHEIIDFLFRVDRYAERAALEWTQLLARAVLSGIVLGQAPAGVLTEAKADWLLEKIGGDRIATARGLELLARVIARADAVPDWLQEMLVELSAECRAPAAAQDARQLQALLAETYPAADAPTAGQEAAEPHQIAAARDVAKAVAPIALAA